MKYIILAITLLLTSCLDETETKIAKKFLDTQCLDYELFVMSRKNVTPREEGHANCLCKNRKWKIGGLRCGDKTCTWTGDKPCSENNIHGSGSTTNSSSTKPEKIIETKIETKIETVYVELKQKELWE